MALTADDPAADTTVLSGLLSGPFSLAALDRCESDVAAVEQALADLEHGSFGRCEACGGPVEAPVLDADPFARRCTRHAAHVHRAHEGVGGTDGGVPPEA